MWSMCIILIVVVLQKHLSQSLECNKLTNKRFYGNLGNKTKVGCTHSESIEYCHIINSAETERCTIYKNTDKCSVSGITFVGNINKETCEFEVEVKSLKDVTWRLQISELSYREFNVFGLYDCFKVNEDYSGFDQGYSKAESVFECQKQCQNKPDCLNWAWITENGKNWNEIDEPKGCFFKGNTAGSTTIKNVISGPRNCPVAEFKILSCSELTSGKIFSGNSISFSCTMNQVISQCTLKKIGDSNKIYQSSSSTESRAKFSYSSDKNNCTVELTNLVEEDSGVWIFELRGESTQNVQYKEFQLQVQSCFETNTLYNAVSNEEFQSNSPSDCQSACLKRSNCDMWTFAPQGNCMLFGVENYKGKTSQSGFVSGPDKCYGCYRLGIGIQGREEILSKPQANSPKECQRHCRLNEACKFFNFNTRAKNCFLRSGVTQDKFKENQESVVGAKDCADPSAIWETDSTMSSTIFPYLQTAPTSTTPPTKITTTRRSSTTTFLTTPGSTVSSTIFPYLPTTLKSTTPATKMTTITTPITTAETISTSTEISMTGSSDFFKPDDFNSNDIIEDGNCDSCNNSGLNIGLTSGLSVIVLLLVFVVVCQWFRIRRDTNELNNIKKQRSEGPVTMSMLKNEPYEVVEIQTEDKLCHEPYEEIIPEGEEPYEEIVSEDEVKEPGASPKTPDPSYFFQYYPPPKDDEATGKRDSSYKFEYYKPGQDEEEKESLKSHGSEYIIHQMSDDSE